MIDFLLKGAETFQKGKRAFSKNNAGTRHQYEKGKKKKMNLDPYLTLHTTQKLITNLNVKVKTIKLLEEITGKYLSNLGIGKDFLNSTQKSTI